MRKVKNPTATGIRIKTTDTHNKVNPITGGKVWGVVVPLLVTSMGVPLAIRKPQIQLNKLAQPQANAVTTVAMIPIVLFCIFLLRVYFCFAVQQFDLLGKSCQTTKSLAS